MKSSKQMSVVLSVLSVLFSTLAGNARAAGIPAYEVEAGCSGGLTVLATHSAQYIPAEIFSRPRRVEPRPASATYLAEVEVNPNDSCAVFKDKYAFDLSHLKLTIQVSLGHPVNQAKTEAAAQAVVGQKLYFTTQQTFKYLYRGFLPLFPKVHDESFAVKGQVFEYASGEFEDFKGSFGANLAVDALKAYGIPPIQQLPDADKLEVAQIAASLVAKTLADGFLPSNIEEALLDLKPLGLAAQSSYLQILLSVFASRKQAYPAQSQYFFEPWVGGTQSLGLHTQVNVLSQVAGLLTPSELVELGLENPGLLLVGYPSIKWGASSCFNIDAEGLTALVQKVDPAQVKPYQKRPLAELLTKISGGLATFEFCLEGKVTPATKALAAEKLGAITAAN